MSAPIEAAFEEHIAAWLVEYGGYRHMKFGNVGGGQVDFDPVAGVDTADLFEFIGATQSRQWGSSGWCWLWRGSGRSPSGFREAVGIAAR